MKNNYSFKPRARLLIQLGDQLIRNESIALVELIKNSYDADASLVNVYMSELNFPEKGVIIIKDNGFGMDLETILNVWLEPGSDFKANQIYNNVRTPKFKRLPIGEKGIGRFGAHKLGNVIQLITKKKNNKEIVVTINWRELVKKKYLTNARPKIEERNPIIFKGSSTGTQINITDLNKEWTRGEVREIHRSITALCSPFEENNTFDVSFDIDNKEWLKGLPKWKDIKESSLFSFDAVVVGEKIVSFEYQFKPWSTMTKISGRKVTLENNQIVQKLKYLYNSKTKLPIDLSEYNIGELRFSGLIFIRDVKTLKLGFSEIKTFRKYLDENGGVRIYRDGIRVYDYGERGNDWLGLDYRRFNTPGIKVSNNSIIAAVQIDRESSQQLIEKANREGFIENKAFDVFRESILHTLNIVEQLRREDKDRLDEIYGSTPKLEPVLSSIDKLKNLLEEKSIPQNVKEEALKHVFQIEAQYKFMRDTLTRSASAGLSLGVVIHEVDKIIQELEKVIKKENVSDRMLSLVKHLGHLIESYSQILAKSERKNESLKTIINQTLFNIEFRLSAHKISIVKEFEEFNKDAKVNVARNLIVGTLINILDNSIYWLGRSRINNKKVYIKLVEENGFYCILIADNGPGFALSIDDLTEPFVSAKIDGLGLGLHIAKEIMSAHNGYIEFPEWGENDIPSIFKNGAIVKLGFKK